MVTLAVSSFSYDDLADWDIYAAAMPLRRWELVSAKYLLVLILIVMAGVLNAVLAIAATLTHGSFDGPMFLIFGALAGLLVWLIRSFGGYPDGVAFAVLLANITVPLIDYYTRPRVYGHR